jgi:uncharacterized protein YdhG (YjbR/CyaY superfamily)
MAGRSKTIDEYLAGVGNEQREALKRLRRTIKSAAPRAEECISYQLPAFRLDGRMLVAFAAWSKHCALYPMSAAWLAAHGEEFGAYELSKGTIRFQPSRPLPAALVRKLVRARMAENAERRKR